MKSPCRHASHTKQCPPCHPPALTGLPHHDVSPGCVHAPGNLVPRHPRILNSRPVSFFHQRVTVTNAARFHIDAHLTPPRLRNRPLHHFKLSTRLADLHRFHRRPRFSWINHVKRIRKPEC